MGRVEAVTGQLIARAIQVRAGRNEFGIIVRDMPEYEPEVLVTELGKSRERGIDIRLAMPGFEASQARGLARIARRAGFGEAHFVTSVEGAERWRNAPQVQDTIVVVTPRELPKMNSLNRFVRLTGSDLHKHMCGEGIKVLGVNEAQKHLWQAFRRKALIQGLPLEGLLAYYSELSTCSEDEIPTRSRELLYLFGLLPDPELFTAPSAAKIADRLRKNLAVVDQLEVLSRTDRQRLSRALARRSGTRAHESLQTAYKKVMTFYREQNPDYLRDLTLEEVQSLLRTQQDRSRGDAPADGDEAASAEKEPTVRGVDILMSQNDETLSEFANVVRTYVEAEDEDDEDQDNSDPETGEQLDIKRKHPFMRVVERYVGPNRWGGVVDLPQVGTLDEALAILDKADFRPFVPNGEEWHIRSTLGAMVEQLGLDPAMLAAYDRFCETREKLASDIRTLLLYPLVQINASQEYFACAEDYISSYGSSESFVMPHRTYVIRMSTAPACGNSPEEVRRQLRLAAQGRRRRFRDRQVKSSRVGSVLVERLPFDGGGC